MFMKVKIDPDCVDIHAKKIVDMYKDLKTPLEKIRAAKDLEEAKKILDRFLHDAILLGFFKGHGPLNVEVEGDTMYILDENDRKLSEDRRALAEVKNWKES